MDNELPEEYGREEINNLLDEALKYNSFAPKETKLNIFSDAASFEIKTITNFFSKDSDLKLSSTTSNFPWVCPLETYVTGYNVKSYPRRFSDSKLLREKFSTPYHTYKPKLKKCMFMGCKRGFTTSYALKWHIKSDHDGLIKILEMKPYICPVPSCPKVYKNNNGLRYHLKRKHKTIKYDKSTFKIIK